MSSDAQAGEAFMEIIWGDRFDLSSEHFKGTPERFVKMLRELTLQDPFEFTTFESNHDEMIVIKDIDFVSLCAHHIVPFMGKAHIAYVPRGKIAGLSKFARVVASASSDLTVQEDLTGKIADFLEKTLEPLGVAVVMEAEHMCMTIRGIKAPGTKTVTSVMRGVFADHTRMARQEFLQLIKE
jgi:GTP cyclohydrolase I